MPVIQKYCIWVRGWVTVVMKKDWKAVFPAR
jgi:hypothetical protein